VTSPREINREEPRPRAAKFIADTLDKTNWALGRPRVQSFTSGTKAPSMRLPIRPHRLPNLRSPSRQHERVVTSDDWPGDRNSKRSRGEGRAPAGGQRGGGGSEHGGTGEHGGGRAAPLLDRHPSRRGLALRVRCLHFSSRVSLPAPGSLAGSSDGRVRWLASVSCRGEQRRRAPQLRAAAGGVDSGGVGVGQ